MDWYYKENEEIKGPVSSDELKALLKSGQITLDTLVKSEKMEDWKKLDEYKKTTSSQRPSDKSDEIPEQQSLSTENQEKEISQPRFPKEEAPEKPGILNLEFQGSAGEYFRIWIVNLFLTIITLGIYAAWASVRTRQYFYANTRLDGEQFEYLANPIAILKGNLIVAGGFLLYMFSGLYSEILTLVIILIFAVVMPFLIFKSLRFSAYNTAYRNIRFNFRGKLSESYFLFLLFPFLIALSLGLAAPYWAFKRKAYFFRNFNFGSTENEFEASAGYFYKIYLAAFGLGILLLGFMGFFVFSSIGLQTFTEMGQYGDFDPAVLTPMFSSMFIMVFVYMVGITAIEIFIYSKITNHCLENTSNDTLKLKSDLGVWPLVWIRISNTLAILISLGFLRPWAKVRRYRYLVQHIRVEANSSLDNFCAAQQDDVGALGESAVDFFDLDISLW